MKEESTLSKTIRRMVALMFVLLPLAILAILALSDWMTPSQEYDIIGNVVPKPPLFVILLAYLLGPFMLPLLPLLLGGIRLFSHSSSTLAVLLCVAGIAGVAFFDMLLLFTLGFSTNVFLPQNFLQPILNRWLFLWLPPTLLTSLLVLATARGAWRFCLLLPLACLIIFVEIRF